MFNACIVPGCHDEDLSDLDQTTGLCGGCARSGAPALAAEVQRLTAERAALVVPVEGVDLEEMLVEQNRPWAHMPWEKVEQALQQRAVLARHVVHLRADVEEAHAMLREGLLAGPLVTGRTEVGLLVRDRLLGWVFTSFAAELVRSEAPNNPGF